MSNSIIQYIRNPTSSPMASTHPPNPRLALLYEIEKCPDCGSQLEPCDILKYCPQCRKCPTLMDTSMREPNYNFRQHYQENRVSAVVKIQAYAKDILCKINLRLTDGEIDRIVEKVRSMHRRRGVNCKGYRQESAVVILKQFQDQIRMTAHQFCLKTGISRKKFNKMYLHYQSMVKSVEHGQSKIEEALYEEDASSVNLKEEQDQRGEIEHEDARMEQYIMPIPEKYLKLEQKQQEKKQQKQQQQKEQPVAPRLAQQKQQEQRQILTKTLQKLYDKIFSHIYLKNHKTELIFSIINKSLSLYRTLAQQGQANLPKKYFRAPAIIYNVIKMHGYKISKKNYIATVERYLEVKLTDAMINKFAINKGKTKTKVEDDDEGSSPPTSLQNRNDTPTGSQNLLSA